MKNIIRLLALTLTLVASPLFAQTHDWTSFGGGGRVDAASAFRVAFGGPTMRFISTQTGTIVARYPVTNTYGSGSSKTPPWTTLWATFTDDSASGSVTARLYEVDKCTGNETLICTITSTNGTTTPRCSSCSFSSSTFDFANNTYWVEVTLSRTATTATEEIHSLAVN